jgi:hypothetical protein
LGKDHVVAVVVVVVVVAVQVDVNVITSHVLTLLLLC